MNKRILLSLGMIVVTGAVVVGGTGAFFSDTETSSNNVFTAGDVTLSLGNLDHTYLADGTPDDPVANYVNIDGNTNSFQFADLKPLDWGSMDGDLTNGGNDAFVCARVVAPNTATVSPFQDLLKFRVNNGLGLTVANTLALTGLNQWFSMDPTADALAMASGLTIPSEVQYCFGDFEAGTPGQAGTGDCVIDPTADYNAAQNQTLTLDIEYYAVQQRNNSGFTCAGLNEEFTFTHNADTNNNTVAGGTAIEPVRVNSLGSNTNSGLNLSIGDTMTVDYAFPNQNFTLDITNGGDDYEFVVTMPYVVTGDSSMSIFFDTDNDNTPDFQYAYSANNMSFQTSNGTSYTPTTAPTGYSSSNSNETVFTFTIPKSEFNSTFRVAVNGTQNNNPITGTHVQLGIPVADIFADGFFSSADYLVITP